MHVTETLVVFAAIVSMSQSISQASKARVSAGGGASTDNSTLFLPNFCSIQMVFGVVVLGELLALVLVLSGGIADVWNRLGLVSLFVQWIILSSSVVLCLARPVLTRFSDTAAAIISYLLLLMVTVIVSELAYRITNDAMQSDHSEFLLGNLLISAIISALVLRYLYISHQWKQQIQAEAHARVQALQARIRPHFLFNSMNSIAALTRSDPVRAERAVEDLAELFRGSLRDASEFVTLHDEIETTKRYLSMESLRLDDRLKVEWDIETLPMQRKVPSLILQPVLENAIYHGIEPLPEGGTVRIHGYVEGNSIRISVTNPKPSVTREGHKSGNQIAMNNIRLRLQLAFGPHTGLAMQESAYDVVVTLFFPREKAK